MKYALILSVILSFGISSDLIVADQFEITGIVTDELNNPLVGAMVFVENSAINTQTDVNGKFKLEVPSKKSVIVVSYLGYEMETFLANKSSVNIVLKPTTMLLDEIEVVGHKVSKPKANISFAVSHIAAQSAGISIVDKTNTLDEEAYYLPSENVFQQVSKNPYSTFALDVDRASYANVRRYLQNGQLPPREAIRIEEMINYFDYQYEAPKGKDPINISAQYFNCPWNEDHKLMHVAMSTEALETEELPPSHLVFLVDVSGSMSDQNKLPLVKASLKMLVNHMRTVDKISIVTYSGQVSVALEAATIKEKRKIIEAIESLSAGGSTAGGSGIQMAYQIARDNYLKEGNNRVVMATDGDFNVGISSADALEQLIEKERKSGVYLSVLGYGIGNYKDHQMQTLADKGNGNHAYIDNIQEARKTLISEFGSNLFTVAKDVKIQIEFNPAYIQSYRLVGYENRMLKDEDFNNDRVDAGELGPGHQVTAIYEIIPVGSKSNFSARIDDLKFQENKVKTKGEKNGLIADIKCRYKTPQSSRSQKFNVMVGHEITPVNKLDENIRFSLSVAEFGLIISESSYVDGVSLSNCIKRARSSRSYDPDGFKAEFIRLCESVKDMGLVVVE